MKFHNYKIKKNFSDYVGSYTFYNESKVVVAKTVGMSIKRRNIYYKSRVSEKELEIYKEVGKKYLFVDDDEMYGGVESKSRFDMNQLILTTHKLEKIFLSSKDFNKTYRIYYNKNEIGIVVCDDWERSPIGLSITSLDHIDEIFCSIAVLGYYFNVRYKFK